MQKIAEEYHLDGDKIVQKNTFNLDPTFDRIRLMRDLDGGKREMGHHVASVPMALVAEWAKEAGLEMSDPAMAEVLKRKLLDGSFSKLRVWEGRF